jgi:hypothetical protein
MIPKLYFQNLAIIHYENYCLKRNHYVLLLLTQTTFFKRTNTWIISYQAMNLEIALEVLTCVSEIYVPLKNGNIQIRNFGSFVQSLHTLRFIKQRFLQSIWRNLKMAYRNKWFEGWLQSRWIKRKLTALAKIRAQRDN